MTCFGVLTWPATLNVPGETKSGNPCERGGMLRTYGLGRKVELPKELSALTGNLNGVCLVEAPKLCYALAFWC